MGAGPLLVLPPGVFSMPSLTALRLAGLRSPAALTALYVPAGWFGRLLSPSVSLWPIRRSVSGSRWSSSAFHLSCVPSSRCLKTLTARLRRPRHVPGATRRTTILGATFCATVDPGDPHRFAARFRPRGRRIWFSHFHRWQHLRDKPKSCHCSSCFVLRSVTMLPLPLLPR